MKKTDIILLVTGKTMTQPQGGADVGNEPDHDIDLDIMERVFGGSNAEDGTTGPMDSPIHDGQYGNVPVPLPMTPIS